MRVSPDGTVHGLRPSHQCRAACRMAADPRPARLRVALNPVIDYRPYIFASPDVFPAGHRGSDQGVAGDLQIPEALKRRIEAWIDEFTEHFLHLGDRPVDLHFLRLFDDDEFFTPVENRRHSRAWTS